MGFYSTKWSQPSRQICHFGSLADSLRSQNWILLFPFHPVPLFFFVTAIHSLFPMRRKRRQNKSIPIDISSHFSLFFFFVVFFFILSRFVSCQDRFLEPPLHSSTVTMTPRCFGVESAVFLLVCVIEKERWGDCENVNKNKKYSSFCSYSKPPPPPIFLLCCLHG